MSDNKRPGFWHLLQRLFGGGKPKLPKPAPSAQKNSLSHAQRKPVDNGPTKKEPPSDKPAKKEPPSHDKPAKKLAAKPKPGIKLKAPPPAAPAEVPGEVPPHERPAARRKKEGREKKAAPSIYTPATPEKLESKTEPSAKPALPPTGRAAPGEASPEDLPPAERKTGKPSA
jgi:hypothetical protein